MSIYYAHNNKINVTKKGEESLVLKNTKQEKEPPPDYHIYGYDSYVYYAAKFKPIFSFYNRIFK